MKFGAVPVAQAEGGVAVHSIRQSGLVLKKGTLIGKPEVAALQAAGIAEIVVARIEPGDVSEDAAAAEIAAAVAGEGVRVDRAFTGRANLFAESAGVLVVDKDAIDRLNQIDESITFATLAAYKPVVAGEMIATVKIIPFAVAANARDAALAAARARPLVRVAPYRVRKIGVVSTMLPGLATKVIEKTLRVTEERLMPAGATIVAERRVPHEQGALAKRDRGGSGRGRRTRARVRSLGHRRPTGRDPRRRDRDRRTHRAFRHAGRSRQSAPGCRRPRAAAAWGAGLRPLAKGKRFRLGSHAVACRT